MCGKITVSTGCDGDRFCKKDGRIGSTLHNDPILCDRSRVHRLSFNIILIKKTLLDFLVQAKTTSFSARMTGMIPVNISGTIGELEIRLPPPDKFPQTGPSILVPRNLAKSSVVALLRAVQPSRCPMPTSPNLRPPTGQCSGTVRPQRY
jgi:hypothetical protein